MKKIFVTLILIFSIPLLFSCKKKVEVSQVLPVIGLYEGRISGCYDEELLIVVNDTMNMLESSYKEPYVRRVLVSSLKEHLKNESAENFAMEKLGLADGKINGDHSKSLVIETNWLCLSDSVMKSMCMDTTQLTARFPIAVVVGKTSDSTNPFKMSPDNTPQTDAPCGLVIDKLSGFHINGSLQIEYEVNLMGEKFKRTLVCQKN